SRFLDGIAVYKRFRRRPYPPRAVAPSRRFSFLCAAGALIAAALLFGGGSGNGAVAWIGGGGGGGAGGGRGPPVPRGVARAGGGGGGGGGGQRVRLARGWVRGLDGADGSLVGSAGSVVGLLQPRPRVLRLRGGGRVRGVRAFDAGRGVAHGGLGRRDVSLGLG